MNKFRLISWILVAMVGGILVYASTMNSAREAGLTKSNGVSGDLGGPFTAKLADGSDFTHSQMLGRPHAIFFGFAHCPDVCPLTLYEAGQWLKELGADGDSLDIYFVTVDPERDTPEVLNEYLGAFDKRIRGISGTPDQINKIVKSWHVYAKKSGDGPDYNVDHTATTFLMNAKGEFVRTISYGENTEVAIEKLRKLVAGR